MFAQKFLRKENIYMACIERYKKCSLHSYTEATKFIFVIDGTKMLFSAENMRVNIECPDIHAKFRFQFFDILNMSINNGFIFM
jgi:hypothetical protein